MQRWTLFCILFFLARPFYAQIDTFYSRDYLEKSTKFAWLTLGGDLLALDGGQADYLQSDALRNTSFDRTWTPRLTIGGIHFWGHADFYVTFPLSFLSFHRAPDVLSSLTYRQGIETGARFYPLKLQPGRVSPFAGISFRSLSFQHAVEEDIYAHGTPVYERMIAPLQLGATYATESALFTASIYYQSPDHFDYYISPAQTGRIEPGNISLQLGFVKYWDTDVSARTAEGVRQLNLKHEILRRENRLSAWYWGVGPSAGLRMSGSDYLEKNFPYLADAPFSNFMPDLTFGRFFHEPDINIGVSYRTLGARLQGFDTDLRLRRHSFMLEAYKNLFNWLGFVPFAGVTASVERLSARFGDQSYTKTKPALGFIFGWDIRLTKTGTNLLRTNLRWIPDLHLEIEGDRLMFNHLEFNFIQYVHFIGRGKVYDQYARSQ